MLLCMLGEENMKHGDYSWPVMDVQTEHNDLLTKKKTQ